jgi:MazG family protein
MPSISSAPFRHQGLPVDLQPFCDVIACLRAPDGCPWDLAQTHVSLLPYLMEESWEFAAAVESGDPESIREELGDVLLQVVLHAQIASESGWFTLQEVADGISAKMVDRHPHVFGGATVEDAAAVEAQWNRRKAEARAGQSLLTGVPPRMPAMARALKLTRRAATVGFDWTDSAQVMAKVREELAELEEAMAAGDRLSTRDELGDLMFALVNLARKLDIDPDEALHSTSDRFMSRFQHMEYIASSDGQALSERSLDDLEGLWQQAKRHERGQVDGE